MKFRAVMRMQMILMGMGAALLLASSAYAQQDTNPTIFPDGGNVEPFRQPAAVTANNAITLTTDAANAQQAIDKPAATEERVAARQASTAQWTTADAWGVVSVLVATADAWGVVSLLTAISITLVTVYSLAERRRERSVFPRSVH